MIVRVLGPEDQNLFTEFLIQHKPTWGTYARSNADTVSQNLLNSELFRVVATLDDEIMMTIATRRWTSTPVYSLIEFKTRALLPFSTFKRSFRLLIENAVKAMELEGRREFWYVIEDKNIYLSRSSRQGRNILQYLVPCLNEYTIFSEERVEAGAPPRWPLYADLLSNTAPKSTTVIRRAIHNSKLLTR